MKGLRGGDGETASKDLAVTSSSRPLGIGLLAGGGGILLLMLLWLFVSGAQGGGIVLGLILVLILAGPLVGAGWYVLSRQSAEQASIAAFSAKRRVLDSDRIFRQDVGEALRRLADRLPAHGAELRALADDVQGSAHRGVAWEELVQLDESGLGRLARYDDLVRQRVRQLRDSNPDQVPESSIRELRQALDQREDLLALGRRAPELEPSLLLRSGAPASDVTDIGMGDAVSYGSANYVAESVASYFAEGQTWKLARLAPAGGNASVAWLYVGPGGQESAWLSEVSDTAVDPATLAQAGSGTAVVDVTSTAGTARGVLVEYRRYRGQQQLALVERWPDGASHSYLGTLLGRGDLQVWPAAARPG